LWNIHRAAIHLPIDIISGSAAAASGGHSAHVDEAERRRRETNSDTFAIYARLTRDSNHIICIETQPSLRKDEIMPRTIFTHIQCDTHVANVIATEKLHHDDEIPIKVNLIQAHSSHNFSQRRRTTSPNACDELRSIVTSLDTSSAQYHLYTSLRAMNIVCEYNIELHRRLLLVCAQGESIVIKR
jgi:hypothetical protein